MYTYRKQSVAVTGATGQIGIPLTRALLTLGHEVPLFSGQVTDQNRGLIAQPSAQALADPTFVFEHPAAPAV